MILFSIGKSIKEKRMKTSNFYLKNKHEIEEKLKESDFKGTPLFLSQYNKNNLVIDFKLFTKISTLNDNTYQNTNGENAFKGSVKDRQISNFTHQTIFEHKLSNPVPVGARTQSDERGMEHIWVEGCMTHIPLTPFDQSPSHLSYIFGFRRVKVDCSMIRFGRSNSLVIDPTVNVDKLFDPSKIATLRDMMIDEDGFSIGVDSEYELVDNEREIISWQFAFVLGDKVYELVVFPLGNKLLNFESMISWIIETFDVWSKFGCGDSLGYNFSAVRTWKIALGGKKKYKMVDTFSEALSQSCPEYSKALEEYGVRKAEMESKLDAQGRPCYTYKEMVCGAPVGFLNDFDKFKERALTVNIICHFGSADLTTFKYNNEFLSNLVGVGGGLISTTPIYTHNVTCSDRHHFYPLMINIRDTMCYTPKDFKKLSQIGELIGVNKVELNEFDKGCMTKLLLEDPKLYLNYASTDAKICLLYAMKLFGFNKKLPATVSSAAAKSAKEIIKEYMGCENNAEFEAKFKGLTRTKSGLVMSDKGKLTPFSTTSGTSHDGDLIRMYASSAFHGGYNASMNIGYYDCPSYDFDLKAAYPTAMGLIPDIDWNNPIAMEIKNQELTVMHIRTPFEPLFALVDFEFPENVAYPCIPIEVDGNIIYPRTSIGVDGVFACGPELWLANQLGAKIFIRRGYLCNPLIAQDGGISYSLRAVAQKMVKDRGVARLTYGKGSLPEILLKNGVNSVYGKLAQNIRQKRVFSAKHNKTIIIGDSPITSPCHASMLTSAVRTMLLATVNEITMRGKRVFSVTTDGFISDTSLDELNSYNLFGLRNAFRAIRQYISGRDDIWEVKHAQNDLLNLTTRGNVSLNSGLLNDDVLLKDDEGIILDDEGNVVAGVVAHNSYISGYEKDSYEDRLDFMIKALTRTGKIETKGLSFTRTKDLIRKDGQRVDFGVVENTRYLSMDFDLKREIDEITDVYPRIEDKDYYIANFTTKPYLSVLEYKDFKRYGKNMNCLRTRDELNTLRAKALKDPSFAPKKTETTEVSDWDKLRSCVIVIRQQKPLGFLNNEPYNCEVLLNPKVPLGEKLAYINERNLSNKKFEVSQWKDARRPEMINRLLDESEFKELLEKF